jgi:hypothetical protein
MSSGMFLTGWQMNLNEAPARNFNQRLTTANENK